jgi:hypothetical protein
MILKLKHLPSFKIMNTEKDVHSLMITIKNLIFVFNWEKEYEVSLVRAGEEFPQ